MEEVTFGTVTYPPPPMPRAHLFFQCRAQTTMRMRAVRTMTSTGTRTAARTMSESRNTRVNTTQQCAPPGKQSSGGLPHLCRCEEASWYFGYLAGACFGWPGGGALYVQMVGCDDRWVRSPTSYLVALLLHRNVSCFFLFPALISNPGLARPHPHIPVERGHPSSSNLRAILWCHRVGFTLTKRASIGGIKLFLTSST